MPQQPRSSSTGWSVERRRNIIPGRDGDDAGEDLSQVVSWGNRNSPWYQMLGEDSIFEAFRTARTADPEAKLFYNDYWNYLDDKRAAIIEIIQKFQAEDLIDGVGLQCHLNIDAATED